MYSGWLGALGCAFYVAVVFALFALALLAWHACALHAHPGAPGTAGVTAFTAIAGGVVVCVIIDMRVFQCFIPGIALFEKTDTRALRSGVDSQFTMCRCGAVGWRGQAFSGHGPSSRVS